MDQMELENRELKDEVSKLTTLMESFIAAQNQPAPTYTNPQRTVISEIIVTPVPGFPTIQPAQAMHSRFMWGIPTNFVPEGYAPTATLMLTSNPIMSSPPPIMNAFPRVEETIYHFDPYEGPNVYEKIDEIKGQFQELRKELKTLRGKDLFGKSVVELCLVPKVKIPIKLKVPYFEKYKGNTCPLIHLVMYVRKMSTQTDNDQFLIHYFQDSLTGAALQWYMGLDTASVCTFNDLGEAFAKKYKYNVDMSPDRDQLRSMSQKDK
ncbi:uncharacterized protein LOC127122244 [Lathyrus oleraceus]|uniref:uncharacterized protein LOC127122244 n=1 Tax=Pisum sativum TaxID=3888 RepID=UPI0021CE0977|nr:uncharacterized protein LOC127122244 [Pisum sativum]